MQLDAPADAATELRNYRNLMAAAVPALLASAEPWSLFNQDVHDQHYAALRQVMQSEARFALIGLRGSAFAIMRCRCEFLQKSISIDQLKN